MRWGDVTELTLAEKTRAFRNRLALPRQKQTCAAQLQTSAISQ